MINLNKYCLSQYLKHINNFKKKTPKLNFIFNILIRYFWLNLSASFLSYKFFERKINKQS